MKYLCKAIVSVLLGFSLNLAVAINLSYAASLPTQLSDNEVLSVLQVSNHAALELAKIALQKTSDKPFLHQAQNTIDQAQTNLTEIKKLVQSTHMMAKPSMLSNSLFKEAQNIDIYFRSLSDNKFMHAYAVHDKAFRTQMLQIIEAKLFPNIHSALLLALVRQYQKQIEALA